MLRGRILLVVIIFIAAFSRFLFLETSPPGYYIDEAVGSSHIACMADSGYGSDGARLPLFFLDFDGYSFSFPLFIYFGAAWAKIFGTSPAALRAVPGVFSVVTLAGLYCLATLFTDALGATLVLLCAALSPWGFQLARVAWDPGVMTAPLVWSLYYFFRARGTRDAFIAGALAALVLYAYPPGRLTMPLLLLYLGVGGLVERRPIKYLAAWTAAFVVLAIPIAVQLSGGGPLAGRSWLLTIFTLDYVEREMGSRTPLWFPVVFLRNIAWHLSPGFLFLTGDGNMRHSARVSGELGLLDAIAWLALPFVGRGLWRENRRVVGLALFGIFAGLSGAAATWESLPHSLRAIGAWPFFALLSGIALRRLVAFHRFVVPALGVVATAFMIFFATRYFSFYPHVADIWFDADVRADAERTAAGDKDWRGFLSRRDPKYHHQPLRYYLMHYGKLSCAEARALSP